MSDITYCSHIECYYKDCVRHQHNAPAEENISIADLDDGFCFIPEHRVDPAFKSNREELLSAICKGVQKTSYRCTNPTRAMCDIAGGCYFCATIADALEEVVSRETG